MYNDPQYGMQSQYNQMKKMYDSPIAYYSVTAIIQLVMSIGVFLVAIKRIGNINSVTWTWTMLLLLILTLAMNFVIAVNCTTNIQYYDHLFKAYYDNLDAYFNNYMKGYVILMRKLVKYRIAEAVISWFGVVFIAITIIAFLYHPLKGNTIPVAGEEINRTIRNNIPGQR